MKPASVLVVGAGLIGTSVGLALRRAGVEVLLQDREAERAVFAAGLGAGRAVQVVPENLALAIVAVPPSVTAPVVVDLLRRYPTLRVMDTASVKSHVQREVETSGAVVSRFVGGHPVAGRERGGPAAARGDLFGGRPWILCPAPATAAETVAVAEAAVAACAAQVVRMTADEHDVLFARLSHLPQLMASALAAAVGSLDSDSLALAGQGLLDMTRIAASDPQLWQDILRVNSTRVAEALDGVVALLSSVSGELRDATGGEQLGRLLAAGNRGYAKLPRKRGQPAAEFASVPVVLRDEPGELARLFADVAAVGCNVEDVRVEHTPGLPRGVAELVVAPSAVGTLAGGLTARGWTVLAEST